LPLPGVHLFEELPCVQSDPEIGPFLPADPVDCNLTIETFVHTDQDFVEFLGGKTKVEEYIQLILKGPSNIGVESYYTRQILEHNGGVGNFNIKYVLEHSNGLPNVIVHPNYINYTNSKDYFNQVWQDNYPCYAKDLHIYFTGPGKINSTNVNFDMSIPPCTSLGLGTSTVINLSYVDNPVRAGYTAKHEFGHFFNANHLSNDPGQSCYCDLSQKYLMCEIAPGDAMHNCSWAAISKSMNDNCACFSDSHQTPCGHCTFNAGVTSNVEPLYIGTCKNASEFILTVYIHNDCTTKNYSDLKISYSKGNISHTINKIILLDPMDFNGGELDDPLYPTLKFLKFNGPIVLGPEQKIEFKCKLKLEEIGTNNASPLTNISIWTSGSNSPIASANVKIFDPNIPGAKLYPTNSSTISGLVNNGSQFNSQTCSGFSQRNLWITQDLTINQNHYLSSNTVYLNPGKKIIVSAGKTLTICNANLYSCDDFWNSITLEPGANLVIIHSKINDGEYVTISKGSNNIQLSDESIINNCNHGIYSETGTSGVTITAQNTTFTDIAESAFKIESASSFDLRNSSFNGVGSGVILTNSDATITDNQFMNIGNGYRGSIFNVPPFTGNAIYFNGSGLKSITSQFSSDPHVPGNIFENTNCAILVNNGLFNLQGNSITNAQYGIYIKNSPTQGNKIANNNITADFLAVNLELNGGMTATIKDNPAIKCLATYGSGIQITGNSGNVDITNNSVTNETGQAGIISNGCSNVTIKNNTVYTNASNANRTDGIYLLNSTACNITCNKVSCASFEHSTSAIEIQESPANTISCNEMQGAYCGLVFAGSCNPNIVGENTLGDHGLGLVLVTRAIGGDGIIGPQTHMGNHITGCGSEKDAVNFGTFVVVQQSPFLVSPSAPYLPNNSQELITQGWFENPQQGQEYSCMATNICPQGLGARSSERATYKLNWSLKEQNIGLDQFDNARTWSARKNILQYIKSQKIETGEAKLWLYSFANTSLDLYSDIGVFCNNYFLLTENLQNQLLKYHNQKNSNIGQLTKSGKSLHDLVNSEIIILNSKKNKLINNFLLALTEENPVTIFEQNQKQVCQIRLRQLQNSDELTNSEMNILTEIANKCPYEEGNAVYEARMLLGSLKPVIVKEEDLCGLKENYHFKEKEQAKNILVFPNPSSETINIILNGVEATKIYSGKLLELSGKIVKEFILSNSYELSTFEFEPGMYIISINQNPRWTTKVFIQK